MILLLYRDQRIAFREPLLSEDPPAAASRSRAATAPALAGLHTHARRRRRERAQHAFEVVAAAMLRAHAVEVRGRRAGPGAHELLAGRARHLH
jgi:hypothetical protein